MQKPPTFERPDVIGGRGKVENRIFGAHSGPNSAFTLPISHLVLCKLSEFSFMNDVFSFQPRNARSLIALAIKARTRRRVGRKDTFRSRRYLFYRVLSVFVSSWQKLPDPAK